MLEVQSATTAAFLSHSVDTGAAETPPIFVPASVRSRRANANRTRFPEPTARLRSQTSFHDLFYKARLDRSMELLKATRKARNGDHSAAVLFEDAEKAFQSFKKARVRLGKMEAELPANRKLSFPSVRLDMGGLEASSASEIIRFYNNWIDDARDQGEGPINILYLKQKKIAQLERLKLATEALIEDQKQSGLWSLRIEAGARRMTLSRLLLEACCDVRLVPKDAGRAANFLVFLTRMEQAKPGYRYELSTYQVASLSKRLAACLAKPK